MSLQVATLPFRMLARASLRVYLCLLSLCMLSLFLPSAFIVHPLCFTALSITPPLVSFLSRYHSLGALYPACLLSCALYISVDLSPSVSFSQLTIPIGRSPTHTSA